MWFKLRKLKKSTVLLDANAPRKKQRDQEKKRKLIELDAPSDYHSCYQTLIIIIRLC